MKEKVNEARQRAIEFWQKYSRRQKTFMISVVLAVILFIAGLAYFLTRPEYVTLLTCDSANTASEVKTCLTDAGITYTEEQLLADVELQLKQHVDDGIQLLQYQVLTHMTTNG